MLRHCARRTLAPPGPLVVVGVERTVRHPGPALRLVAAPVGEGGARDRSGLSQSTRGRAPRLSSPERGSRRAGLPMVLPGRFDSPGGRPGVRWSGGSVVWAAAAAGLPPEPDRDEDPPKPGLPW